MVDQILREPLDKATRRYNTYPGAKHFPDLKAQYIEKYGQRNWTAQLTKDVFGTSKTDKLKYAKGSEQYAAAELKYNNNLRLIQRYGKGTIDPARANPTVQKKLDKIGKTLEPVQRGAPKRGLTVTISGTQGQRDRDFTVRMDYQFALQFVQDPTLKDFFHELYPRWKNAEGVLFGAEGDDSGNLEDVTVEVA